ncbi:MAG: glycosyltransferase family 4 protein [Candidatus Hydrogenedentes bacterium]|nr:glycosyltransferase family 4 protein [Candidatus Hydrogenedentota bacterium]
MNTPARCRIAVVGACPFPVPQGSQVYLHETARALQGQGHPVDLVTYGYGQGDYDGDLPLHRAANFFGSRRTRSGPSLAKPFLDAALVSTLRRVVRARAIDVVDAHNYEGLAVALAAGLRPVVYHVHNAMADELPYYTRAKRAAAGFGRWLDRSLPRKADCVVAPHAVLAGYLVDCGCDARRVHVVPPPMDLNGFEPCTERVATPSVLYTGNLDAYQNLPFLIGMMDEVRRYVRDARLTIATHSEMDSTSYPEYVDRVHLSDRASLCDLLRQDAVFVCPRVSWSGYPIKVLNAMAAAQAIVCCESAAHALTHEVDGMVVPDDDIEAFAEAVTGLLRDETARSALGRKAQETLVKVHDPAKVGASLSELFERVCGDASPQSSVVL